MRSQIKKREDLIGDTGTITKSFTVVDAQEGSHGVDVRVRESGGEEYWTSLDDISLDSGVTK
ncbi:hypothetical protein [Bacillus gaemokensis]|uniref:Uncharacterized protein n=1 Tax=Bacillus gaemokensis TaxID=574375 RepID=A0A073K5E2_9BACI|nr:hypothetical protein [Bacillus gaemokensis]KEK22499.1 hypothetical protein BAGA_19050 [Bacillus gaemokensis]KYG28804.1 hypothetical protein AZF08_13855 [Bacillus gaemokensis]